MPTTSFLRRATAAAITAATVLAGCVGNRVFALMGYEIVEGRVSGNGISEVQRISFAPASIRIGG